MRKGNKTLKAAFLTGTLFCMIPVFGFVFSGFGALNNRWCYAYAMLIAVITAKMSEELKNLSGRDPGSQLCMHAAISVSGDREDAFAPEV